MNAVHEQRPSAGSPADSASSQAAPRGNLPQAYSHLGLIENALNPAEHRAR